MNPPTLTKPQILIIIPRYELTNEKNYIYTFPLGLAYISAVLKKNNYNVSCFNMNHHKGTIRNLIKKELDKKNYDIVCTGNNALGYNTTKIIVESIKDHSSKPKIILGGPIITTQPELYFNELKPDIGVIGEGEETIVELIDALVYKKDLSAVNGIIFRKNDKTTITDKRNPLLDLDSIPFPDFEGFKFEELLSNMKTNYFYPYNAFDEPRVYPILCSRSCPFNCTFCYHDTRYRTRSIDNIMQELELMVKKYKINMIALYDDCFAIDLGRLKEFCKRISKLRSELSWDLKWTPQLTVKDVSREILKLMKDAGCYTISYGFESYSQEVLKSMKKPISPNEIDYALKETLKSGLSIQGNFIFGDIAETKETAKETLDYWKKSAKGQIQLGFIQPYPGSKIYDYCIKKGIIKNEIEFIKNLSKSNILNMTSMPEQDFKNLINEVFKSESKYSKFISPIKLKETEKNVYSLTTKCPYCGHIETYKNCLIKNKYSYSFNLVCRNCPMRFNIASRLRRMAYKHHNKIRIARSIQIKSMNYIKKLKIVLSNKLPV